MGKPQSKKRPIKEPIKTALSDNDANSEKSFKTFSWLIVLIVGILLEIAINIIFKPINVLWVWIGWVANMDAELATFLSSILVGLFIIAAGASILFYKNLLQSLKNKKRLKAIAILGSIWLFMAIVIVLTPFQIKAIHRTNETISTQATENANLLVTQTADAEVIRELKATIEYNETETAKSTPTPKIDSITDLPPCDFEKENYPCKYWTKSDELFSDIAKPAYKNVGLAGRIAEFYRDENGNIPAREGRKLIIVPDPTQPQNVDYYDFYFGLLEPSIPRCNRDAISFPCWLVSEGEPYRVLAELYPMSIDVDCIRRANKTQWINVEGKLGPKDAEEVGTVIVLPVCP